MNTTYIYRIDLNERGIFNARVIDEHDNTVYSVTNEPQECSTCYGCINNGECVFTEYDGEIPEVRDGFMRWAGDVDGLTEYLRDLQIIGKDADIMHECDVPVSMLRHGNSFFSEATR